MTVHEPAFVGESEGEAFLGWSCHPRGRREYDCPSRRMANLGGDRLIRTPYNHLGGVKALAEVGGNLGTFQTTKNIEDH